MSKEETQNVGGFSPHYQTYKRQKCFVGYSIEASWGADIVGACQKVLPRFGLEPWYASHNFDPTKPLRDKVVEMIANARYGIYDLSYWRKDDKSDWVMPRNVLIELGIAIALNRPTLLLRNAENRISGLELPVSLESVSEYILEFTGAPTLIKAMEKNLPQWVNVRPERDWWNRFCIFGNRTCEYREAHPNANRWSQEKLSCHILDGPDIDQPDFREVVGEVLNRYNDVEYTYLDAPALTPNYSFLLCTYCQAVRSKQFAIYRITSKTPAEVFIAVGMSLALETQFEYRIPKILLARNMQDVPSLLTGYEVILARNSQERKNSLQEFVPIVIQKVRETSWKLRPLPFERLVVPQVKAFATKDESAASEVEKEDLPQTSSEEQEQHATSVTPRTRTEPSREGGTRQRRRDETSVTQGAKTETKKNLFNVGDQDFEPLVLRSDKPVIVHFWALWNGPDRAITPIYERLSDEYREKIAFAKMDVDHHENTPTHYGIQAIPTMIIFNKGKEVERIIGADPNSLKRALDRVAAATA